MTVAAAVVLVVWALTLAGFAALYVTERRERGLRGRLRADVIVTLKTGDEFQGVLFEQDRRILILRGAKQHLPQAVIPVDGELLIRWDDVAYIQKP